MEQLVKIDVASLEGHTEYSLTPKDAVEKVQQIAKDEGKWLYLDGKNVTPSRVTESMLTSAKSIRMMDTVVGGATTTNHSAVIDLHITPFSDAEGNSMVEGSDEKSVFPITIEYIPADPANLRVEPGIRVWVDENQFPVVAHLRNLFFKGTLAKLEEFLSKELAQFKNTYNV